MSANQVVKISDLSPSFRKDLTLVFEVHEVIERSSSEGMETVVCRVVDETGIITACFDQYASKFIVGAVFEIQNFRCKVVDHHLRLEMIKTTVVSKQPLKMGFKDLQNDLSAKFYVTASKNVQQGNAQKQETIKKEEQKVQKKEEEVRQNVDKVEKEARNDKGKGRVDKKQKQFSRPVPKNGQKQSDREDSKKTDKQEERKQKRYVKKEQTTPQQPQQRQQPIKKAYRQKKEEPRQDKRAVQKDQESHKQKVSEMKKPKFTPKCEEIKVLDCPKFQQLQASFIVKVNVHTAIKKQKYWMCKVSDHSGSTYFEFSPETGQYLQDKAWYRLAAFRVFKDRDYGFIATQQKHSSYELLSNWQEKADEKLLWR